MSGTKKEKELYNDMIEEIQEEAGEAYEVVKNELRPTLERWAKAKVAIELGKKEEVEIYKEVVKSAESTVKLILEGHRVHLENYSVKRLERVLDLIIRRLFSEIL